MDIRLHFIVEGQTEETFVNTVLRPHLAALEIWTYARCVRTGRKRGIEQRGGVNNYAKVKNDITAWVKEDQKPDAGFTTMLDLYRLPTDFPGYQEAKRERDPYQRVRVLEEALGEDVSDSRFIPYIQLHEFESLLFAGPQQFRSQFPESDTAVRRLEETASRFCSPERINDGPETAPSKCIIGELPAYKERKASAGPIVAGQIGLPELRTKCKHFGEWIDRLESRPR